MHNKKFMVGNEDCENSDGVLVYWKLLHEKIIISISSISKEDK
jgi:hypothetical protein